MSPLRNPAQTSPWKEQAITVLIHVAIVATFTIVSLVACAVWLLV